MIYPLAVVLVFSALSLVSAYPVDATSDSTSQPAFKSIKITLNCGCWNDCSIERVANPKIIHCLEWCDPRYTCPDLELPTSSSALQQARGFPRLDPTPVTDPAWPRVDPELGPLVTPRPEPVTDPVPQVFDGITLHPITRLTKVMAGPRPTGFLPVPIRDWPFPTWKDPVIVAPVNPVIDPPQPEGHGGIAKRTWECDDMLKLDGGNGDGGNGNGGETLAKKCDPTPWDRPNGPDSYGLVKRDVICSGTIRCEVGGKCERVLECSVKF